MKSWGAGEVRCLSSQIGPKANEKVAPKRKKNIMNVALTGNV